LLITLIIQIVYGEKKLSLYRGQSPIFSEKKWPRNRGLSPAGAGFLIKIFYAIAAKVGLSILCTGGLVRNFLDSRRPDRYTDSTPNIPNSTRNELTVKTNLACAHLPRLVLLATIAVLFYPRSLLADSSDSKELTKAATWNWSSGQTWLERLTTWADATGPKEKQSLVRESANRIPELRGVELHEGILQVAALIDPAVADFLKALDLPWSQGTYDQLDAQLSSLVANGAIPAWLKPDLQLAFCRSLIQNQWIDESWARLQTIQLDSLSDPSSWLFSAGVCQHYLLLKQPCLESLNKLLERESEIPSRYAITARLMLSDIEPLKQDSLDEVARMMNDVERRLTLGRTGKQVRDQEQAIIDKLDKMIDEMEKQAQQQQQQRQQQQQQQQRQRQQQNQQQQQQKAAQDSQPGGGDGQGEVDDKDIGDQSGWGNLPPAARQEALQNITKDLPSHYREVIEAYFKRLSKSPEK
jgi:hypothetical protein